METIPILVLLLFAFLVAGLLWLVARIRENKSVECSHCYMFIKRKDVKYHLACQCSYNKEMKGGGPCSKD